MTVNSVNITPSLNISRFASYNITANVTNTSTIDSVWVNFTAINGDNISCMDFYANGTCSTETSYLGFSMTSNSGDNWIKTSVYPDYLYPELFFAPSKVMWNNVPKNISTWRRSYHVFNFTNNFTMVENMSVWIELYVLPTSTTNSNDLQVYLVGKGQNLSYFTSDWRTASSTQLVGTIARGDSFSHTHTANSSHYLIALTTNSNGTVGTNLNISGQFWIVLYQDSVNVNRGWYLAYHNSSVCNNNGNWFIGDRSGGGTWNTPVYQSGCPNTHLHVARRDAYMDGVNVTVYANSTNGNSSNRNTAFYYADLPNLAPNPTSFVNPVAGGVYNGTTINVTWNPATDPNGDILRYNLSLLNTDLSLNQTLNSTNLTTYYFWNISSVDNGKYNLLLTICDNGGLCANNTLGGNFTINKTDPIYNLSAVLLTSNNSANSSIATSDNKVIVYFNSTGPLVNTSVEFYSGGYLANNAVTIANSSTQYNATYTINSSDVDGSVDFVIKASNLILEYSLTTDNSTVLMDKTSPMFTEIGNKSISENQSLSYDINASDNTTITFWINDTTNFKINSTSGLLQNNTLLSVKTYWLNVSINDSAGNRNNQSIYVTMSSSDDDDDDDSSSSTETTLTVYPDEEEMTEGYTKWLYETWRISFRHEEVRHFLTVDSINEDSVDITIQSETITATILEGEEKKFDLNQDNNYDVSVKVNDINETRTSITVKSITGEVVEEEEVSVAQTTEDTNTLQLSEDKNNNWLVIVIVVLVLMMIAWLIFKPKRPHKHVHKGR